MTNQEKRNYTKNTQYTTLSPLLSFSITARQTFTCGYVHTDQDTYNNKRKRKYINKTKSQIIFKNQSAVSMDQNPSMLA